jgi:hypothetical protein
VEGALWSYTLICTLKKNIFLLICVLVCGKQRRRFHKRRHALISEPLLKKLHVTPLKNDASTALPLLPLAAMPHSERLYFFSLGVAVLGIAY